MDEVKGCFNKVGIVIGSRKIANISAVRLSSNNVHDEDSRDYRENTVIYSEVFKYF